MTMTMTMTTMTTMTMTMTTMSITMRPTMKRDWRCRCPGRLEVGGGLDSFLLVGGIRGGWNTRSLPSG